jgi:tetratricopeptide (TPR) repeat protein
MHVAPEDPLALHYAGWYFIDLQKYARALDAFEKAGQLDPGDGWSPFGQAYSLWLMDMDLQRIPGLLQIAERIGKDTGDYELLNSIGWMFFEMDDCVNATRLFQLVEELAPGATDAQDGIDICLE